MASALESIESNFGVLVRSVESMDMNDGTKLTCINGIIGDDPVKIWATTSRVLDIFSGFPQKGETYNLTLSVKAKLSNGGARLSLGLLAVVDDDLASSLG